MENYSHQSYPDSGESSPLSREIDCENPASWEEPPSSANYKVKFMCSYGGKIQPRSHDNQLSYVGGDTKILSIERNAPFSAFLSKLASICDASDVCFKYQLPDEDLDALISVTNDEDLEHMMLEYDRLNRSSPKPARLRIFLFTATSNSNSISEEYHHFNKEAPKPEGSWFVDALNSAQHRSSPPPPPPPNPEPSPPDFLFGFDKAAPINNNNSKVPDQAVAVAVGEPANFIQSQMERFRIGEGEMHKSYEELNNNPNPLNSPTMYQTEYYSKVQESAPLAPPQGVPVPISAGYWPERGQVVAAASYQVASGIPADQHQQPVYVVQPHAGGGVYHQNPSVRQIPGAGQAYYSVPRAVAETYRDQHAAVPPQPSSLIQQHAGVVGGMQEGMGMVRQPPMVSTEQGYAQVSYVDGSGRPVYYTMAGGGLPPPPPQQYHMMTTAAAAGVDGRAVGGLGMGLDAKAVAGKPPQTSSV